MAQPKKTCRSLASLIKSSGNLDILNSDFTQKIHLISKYRVSMAIDT